MWAKEQADALSAVFDALNESGIQWMVLRNYEGLPQHNRAKDIDLVLSKKDFSHARAIVSKVLLHQGFTKIFNTDFQYVSCDTFFSLMGPSVCSIKIDFLDGFVWRGAQIVDFASLYANRVAFGRFFVPDGVSDGFMLWIKPLMTGGFIKDKYRQDIQRVVKEYPDDFRKMVEATFGASLSIQLWPLLVSGKLSETVPYQRRICLAAWRRAFRMRPFKTVFATVEHFYKEIIRRSRRPPASMVAVVGPDGVGKTTFINLLNKALCDILVKDENAIVVQHFRPNVFPNIKKLLSGRNYDPAQEEFTNPHRAKPASRMSSFVRLIYYWLDYLLGYWLKIRPRCVAGQVYIFDRYFYDFVVDPRRSRINLPEWWRKMFLRITPQPDMIFFLDCDAATIFSRKQELNEAEIARQLGMYRRLAASCYERFVTLDARRKPDELCQKALKQLVERSFDPI